MSYKSFFYTQELMNQKNHRRRRTTLSNKLFRKQQSIIRFVYFVESNVNVYNGAISKKNSFCAS